MPRSPCSDLPPVHGSPQRRGTHLTQGGVAIARQEDRVAALVCVRAGETCSGARISERPDLPSRERRPLN